MTSVHHVGVTVADLERAIAFWRRLLDRAPRDRRLLEGPRLGDLVGYGGARIDSCWFDLPGGGALELLRYLQPEEAPNDPGTARPGNVHVCFQVDDLDAAHRHAVACGAVPVGRAPVEVAGGPQGGTRLAYVRDPDGVTIELRQLPASVAPDVP